VGSLVGIEFEMVRLALLSGRSKGAVQEMIVSLTKVPSTITEKTILAFALFKK